MLQQTINVYSGRKAFTNRPFDNQQFKLWITTRYQLKILLSSTGPSYFRWMPPGLQEYSSCLPNNPTGKIFRRNFYVQSFNTHLHCLVPDPYVAHEAPIVSRRARRSVNVPSCWMKLPFSSLTNFPEHEKLSFKDERFMNTPLSTISNMIRRQTGV